MTRSVSDGSGGRARILLFRQREFRLFWTGETTSQFGTAVNQVALPLLAVKVLHANTFVVAVLSAAMWLPWLLLGLPAGAWVDRVARRPVMIAADVISLVLFASIPIAKWCGVLTIAQLLVVALLAGSASVFFSTAYQAYLPSLVESSDLAEGNSMLQGSASAAQVSGPGLGGVLIQLAGAATGILANAFSFCVSAVCLLAIRSKEAPSAPRDASEVKLRNEILEGVNYLLRDRYLRPATLFATMVNLPLAGIDALLVVFLVRTVGVGSGLVGAALAAIGLGGLIGAFFARRLVRTLSPGRAMIVCTVTTLPFGVLMALTTRGAGLALIGGYAIASAGIIAFNVIYVSFRQAHCPPQMLGRVGAAYMTIGTSCAPLGAALAGVLGSTIGIRPTLWILTVVLAAACLILVFSPLRQQSASLAQEDHVELPVQEDLS
jgi:predicted MFS family arabinose efflux permease